MNIANGPRTCNQPAPLAVVDVLRANAEAHPERIAIAAPGGATISCHSLFEKVAANVAALNALGLGRGDRVAIAMPNGPEMAAAFLSVASAASSAPLNPDYQSNEFEFYMSDLEAKALVVKPGAGSIAVEAARRLGIRVLEMTAKLELRPAQGDGASSRLAARPPEFAQPGDIALVLHTSGTTSKPKIVPLSHKNIMTSADNIRSTLQLTGDDVCLNVMPLFHIHGLIGAALSTLLAGGTLVCTPGFQAPKFLGWLKEFSPTWFTAVPTMHQSLLAQVVSSGPVQSRLRFIRSCSAALRPQLMAEIEKAFGVPVIEAYGMTEASHQIASNPLPPRERKPCSVGLPTGTQVAVADASGSLLPAGESGEIVVRGPSLIGAYHNNPDADARSFFDGWFRTGDQGYIDAEGYVFLTGRLKEMINRGGEKISPYEVEDALLQHPAVAEALVFAIPDSRLGEAVGAAAVLRSGTGATERQLREFAAERLSFFKVPRRVVIAERIPRGPTGKLQRVGLAKKLGLAGDAPAGSAAQVHFVAPRTPLEVTLAAIWSQVLGVDPIGMDDDFLELGGNSILAAEVLSRIEGQAGLKLSFLDLFDNPTVGQLAGGCASGRIGRSMAGVSRDAAGPVRQAVAVQPHGSLPVFFYVLPDNINPFDLRSIAAAVGNDRPLHALLEGNLADRMSVEALAAGMIESMRAVQPRGPYLLGGFCFGGVVAYEMAQQLRKDGEDIPVVVIIDAACPGFPNLRRHWRLFLRRGRRQLADLRTMRPRDMVARALKMLRAFLHWTKIKPSPLTPGERQKAEERARFRMARYSPKPYAGRVSLLATGAGYWHGHELDPRNGWVELVKNLEKYTIGGDHGTLFDEENIPLLAAALRDCLAAACRAQTVANPQPEDHAVNRAALGKAASRSGL